MDDLRKLSGLPHAVREIKMPDGGLLVFKKDKIIIKERNKNKEHLTIWHSNDGKVDVHRTIEGGCRFHIPVEKLDVSVFSDEVVNSIWRASLRRVSLDDSELGGLEIRVPKEKVDFSDRLYKVKGRTATLDPAVAKELDDNFAQITLSEFENSDATRALVHEGDDWVGDLFWTPSGYVFFDQRKFSSMMQSLG